MLKEITKRLDALDSSSKKRQNDQIVNKCEEALGSDAIIERDVLDIITKQLNLRRENTIIREASNLHASLN
jgi:hypothetical protein